MKNQITMNLFGKKLAITFANVDVELSRDSRILPTMHLWLSTMYYAEKKGLPPAILVWGSNGVGCLRELPTRHEYFTPAPEDNFDNVTINAEGRFNIVVNVKNETSDD